MGTLLWQLVAGTRGGPRRAELLGLLERRPYNAHELSRLLGVDYKTARHHLRVLVENGLLVADEGRYGTLYRWSPAMRRNAADWTQVSIALARVTTDSETARGNALPRSRGSADPWS